MILSLSRPPGDLQSSICSLYSFSAVKLVSEVNCCKSKSDICSPSGLKDSKRYKPKMMQSQRDEESQMLVKHSGAAEGEGLVGPRPHHFFAPPPPLSALKRKIIKIKKRLETSFFRLYSAIFSVFSLISNARLFVGLLCFSR